MTTMFRLAAALPMALAASLSAQQPDAARAEPGAPAAPTAVSFGALRTPIHTQADDEGLAYGIWAAGAGYKVSFHDGMRFVPYLGRDAKPVSLAWRTASARVGATELATAAPTLRHTAWRAEYDLGGVVEAYDVRADGVEQTFVIAQRPATPGELVIRGAVASVLQARASADHGGIDYADGSGRALVSYGAAVAIDAAGRRCAMTTTPVEGGIELRLGAEWLATAAFPLVVDPLIAPVTVAAGAVLTEVAVAHDRFGTKNVWYAEVRASGGDEDLRLLRADETGQNAIVVFDDLSASWSAREPSLGVHRGTASVALAFTRAFPASGTTRVRAHVHDRADLGFSGNVVVVPDPTSLNQWRPALGHDLAAVSSSSLLLVYQVEGAGAFTNLVESTIEGATLSCLGTGSVLDQFPIASLADTDFERPTVAEVAVGPTRVWTVGYQKFRNLFPSGGWDVCVRRVDDNVVGGEFVVDGTLMRQEMAPHLGGSDGRLMLFYTASMTGDMPGKPAGANGHTIRGTRLEYAGGAFSTPYGSKLLQVNNDPRLELAGVDFDHEAGSIWGLAFRSTATETIYFRTYGYSGQELTTDTVESPSVAIGTSVGGGVAYQANGDEFLIAYGMINPPASAQARLCRRDYVSIGSPWTSGSGCTSTELDWYGQQWIGTFGCGVGFSQAPANSFTAVLVATQTASLQLFGVGGVHDGCWLLLPISGPDYLGMFGPIVGTSGSWQLSLPEFLTTTTLRFQAVTFDGATGEFYSSARLNVPIGR